MNAPIIRQSTPENRLDLSFIAIEAHENLSENLEELKFCSAAIDMMRCLSTQKGGEAIAYDAISDDTFYEILYKVESTLEKVYSSISKTMEMLRGTGECEGHEA